MTTQPETIPSEQPAGFAGYRALLDAPSRATLWLRGLLGRHLSVRWKLTLWYSFMCALTLCLVGAGIRTALDFQINDSINSSLHQTASRLLPQFPAQLPSIPANPSPEQRRALGICQGQRVVSNTLLPYCVQVQVLLDQNLQQSAPGQFEQAQLYYPNPPYVEAPLLSSITDQAVHVDLALMAQAAQGRDVTLTIPCYNDTCRVYLTRIAVPPELQPAGTVATLEVFQKERNYLDIKRKTDLILATGIPLGVLIALAAGWWIARAALRPVNRISRTVRAIGDSGDLTRRLDFIGPEDEVGQLAHTFDGMMERLQKVFDTQKRFIADASHELRTPLTAIRGNADLMAIAPPDEREACIRAIRAESERMSRLVSDLLLLAEADAEQHPVDKRETDLNELLADIHRSGQVLAAGKVEVNFEPGPETTLLADADRLKQLFLNLLDNAVKFTPAGGQVTIRSRLDNHGACVEIKDTGIGIPPDEQEAIFRRFYRLEESRSTRGTGLGLAICAWIAAAHQGRIDVRSKVGKGTTFTVHLPGVLIHPDRSTAGTPGSTRGR